MTIVLPKEHAVLSPEARRSYERNCQYAETDLRRSGLELDDIFAVVNPYPASTSAFISEALPQCYLIPYWYRDGTPIVDELGFPKMYRIRQNVEEKRYTQPSKEQVGDLSLHPYFHPQRRLHIPEDSRQVYCIVEGEKKYAKLWKDIGLNGCAIGGCWNWKFGEIDVHPEIIADIKDSGATRIVIVADGDWKRYRILTAYGGLVSGLRRALGDAIECEILDLSGTGFKGIDDALVGGLSFEELPRTELGRDVVEHPRILISQYGLIPKETKSSIKIYPCESNYIELLKQHPTFSGEDLWYNEDSMTVMWNGKELSDADIVHLTAHFQKYLSIPEANMGAIRNTVVTVATARSRSPIREWLQSLKWDGVPRVDAMFVDYCEAGDNAYVRETARRLLIGSVARAVEPGCKFDQLTILQGPQGVGKTQFWHMLFGSENVTDIHGMANDKDFMMQINLRWCTNFEELDAYDRRDATQLKAIITSQEDIFRPPYGHAPVKHKRKTVMVGNTNKMSFLKEDVNRREFPLTVGKVDIKRLAADRDQIWAEAYARYAGGEQWWSEEGDGRWEAYKSSFKKDNPYEEALVEIFNRIELTHKYEGKPVVKGITVMRAMESILGNKLNNTIFSDAMERMGWRKIQVRGTSLVPTPKENAELDGFQLGNMKLWVRMIN